MCQLFMGSPLKFRVCALYWVVILLVLGALAFVSVPIGQFAPWPNVFHVQGFARPGVDGLYQWDPRNHDKAINELVQQDDYLHESVKHVWTCVWGCDPLLAGEFLELALVLDVRPEHKHTWRLVGLHTEANPDQDDPDQKPKPTQVATPLGRSKRRGKPLWNAPFVDSQDQPIAGRLATSWDHLVDPRVLLTLAMLVSGGLVLKRWQPKGEY